RKRNVTLVARFLGTGETVSGIVLFLGSALAIPNQQRPDGAYDGCPVVKRDTEDRQRRERHATADQIDNPHGNGNLESEQQQATLRKSISVACRCLTCMHTRSSQLTPPVPLETKNSARRTRPEPIRHSNAATKCRVAV